MEHVEPSWWLNQPIWNICSQIGSFPQVGMKMKNVWNHHLEPVVVTLPATNIPVAPENSQFEKDTCIPSMHFHVRAVSFREGNPLPICSSRDMPPKLTLENDFVILIMKKAGKCRDVDIPQLNGKKLGCSWRSTTQNSKYDHTQSYIWGLWGTWEIFRNNYIFLVPTSFAFEKKYLPNKLRLQRFRPSQFMTKKL